MAGLGPAIHAFPCCRPSTHDGEAKPRHDDRTRTVPGCDSSIPWRTLGRHRPVLVRAGSASAPGTPPAPRSAPPPRAPQAVVRSALHLAPVMSHRPHSPRGDVSWLVVGHVVGMATYRVTPSADRVGFDVAVVGVGGFVQTTLGFTSEAAANAWVNQAMRLTKPWATSRTFGRPKDQ
jgi:hypothetical protein